MSLPEWKELKEQRDGRATWQQKHKKAYDRDYNKWLRIMKSASQFRLVSTGDRYMNFHFGAASYGQPVAALSAQVITYHDPYVMTVGERLIFTVNCGEYAKRFAWIEMKHRQRLVFCKMIFGELTVEWLTFPFPKESKFAELVKWYYKYGAHK